MKIAQSSKWKAKIGLIKKCLFYRVKKSGGAGMLFSFSDPLWAALSLSFFPSFFLSPLSPVG